MTVSGILWFCDDAEEVPGAIRTVRSNDRAAVCGPGTIAFAGRSG